MPSLIPVILSGGSGTRLWPISRVRHPKQFARLLPGETLFQNCLLRSRAVGAGPPIVVSSGEHAHFVAVQAEEAGFEPAAVLLEPVGRNTAPAIVAAALQALRGGGDPVLLVMPSDHRIADLAAFRRAIEAGLAVTTPEARRLVTFGIVPTEPHTGYGYIEAGEEAEGAGEAGAGVRPVRRFVEKPTLDVAQRYLAEGRWFWNSGMFLFRARDILDEVDRFEPGLTAAVEEALTGGTEEDGGTLLDRDAFSRANAISVDYAVMERTSRASVVPASIGWDDIGAWPAVRGLVASDEAGNALVGPVSVTGANNLVYSTGPVVCAAGVRDLVVVATGDAVLVAGADRAQDVGALAKQLAGEGRHQAFDHARRQAAWGWLERAGPEGAAVEIVEVLPGQRVEPGRFLDGPATVVVARGSATAGEAALRPHDALALDPGGPPIVAGPEGARLVCIPRAAAT